MGLFKKWFKKEAKEVVSDINKKLSEPVISIEVDLSDKKVSEVPNKVVTLKYDEHVIPVDAFRKGIQQGATVKAFRDGRFMPLSQLGSDLLIFDLEKDEYVPLNTYENQDYADVKRKVFGGGY